MTAPSEGKLEELQKRHEGLKSYVGGLKLDIEGLKAERDRYREAVVLAEDWFRTLTPELTTDGYGFSGLLKKLRQALAPAKEEGGEK